MGKKRKIYDVVWDEAENVNLADPEIYDVDRKRYFAISQRVYYTRWEESQEALKELQEVKNSIWKNPPWIVDVYYKMMFKLKIFVAKILKK